MNANDFKILAMTFVGVLVLIVLTYIVPVYVLPDGTSVRRSIWNAPSKTVERRYDTLSPEVIKAYESDPAKREIIESLRNQPSQVPYDHYYLGQLFGTGFNILGYITLFFSLGWLGFAGYKGFRFLQDFIEKKRHPVVKKQALPFDVRRLGEKRR